MSDRYVLNPAESRFTVKASATGMLSVFAHSPTIAIRDFNGHLDFSADAPQNTVFELVAQAASLVVDADAPPKDRPEIEATMRGTVLEVEKYPEVRFRGDAATADKVTANWYRLRIQGPLSLHGTQRPVEVDCQLMVSDDQVRLSGTTEISMTAFHIKPVTAAAGLIKVKDELKFSFDLVGQKAPA